MTTTPEKIIPWEKSPIGTTHYDPMDKGLLAQWIRYDEEGSYYQYHSSAGWQQWRAGSTTVGRLVKRPKPPVLEALSSAAQGALTGGSSDYYKIDCIDDDGNHYTVEIKHVINARNMNFNVANVFKACARLGDKEGTSVEYDLEKNIFFTVEELRRRGLIKNNEEALDMFKHKILGIPKEEK